MTKQQKSQMSRGEIINSQLSERMKHNCCLIYCENRRDNDGAKREDQWVIWFFYSPLLHLIRVYDSYQSQRTACLCTVCSWMPVAGMMRTWWLRTHYLEWWPPCYRWCILSLSRTTCLSLTSIMLHSTRPQPELGLCPLLVQTDPYRHTHSLKNLE